MCTITATELKENFGKYMKLGQKEEIQVTHRGIVIFTIVPEKNKLLKRWKNVIGCIPSDASFDDVNRE